MSFKYAKMTDLAGKEPELFKRSLNRRLIGMTLNLSVELGGVEGAADLVALKLCHIDAICGKTAHRLVQRSRYVADPEYESRDPSLAQLKLSLERLAAHNHKARRIVRSILYIFCKYIKSIHLRSQARRNRRLTRVAQLLYLSRSPGRVCSCPRPNAARPQKVPALAEAHDMTVSSCDALQASAGQAHQLEADRHKMFAYDLQGRCGQEVMDISNPAGY
jgi:hypothetical protein